MFNQTSFKYVKGLGLALLVGGTVALTSCNRDDDNNIVTPTDNLSVADIVTSTSMTSGTITSANLSMLQAAVSRAGWADTLRRSNITLFAPTDAAFRAAGYADASAISSAPQATIQQILRYHVLSAPFSSSSVSTSGTSGYSTYGNGTVYIGQNATQLTVNGARVLQTIAATNGTVYIVDRVLMPGTQNLLQIAQADTSLSYLVAAANRVGSTFVNSLSSATGAYTIFAPTNAAFRSAGYTSRAMFDTANVQRLTNLLSYHVVNGRSFTSGYGTSGTLTTLQGGTINTAYNGTTATITGAGNGTNASNFVTNRSDVMATNGVINYIDRVLMPKQ